MYKLYQLITYKIYIMSCCGSKRESLKQSLSSQNQNTSVEENTRMWSDELFEFTGIAPHLVKGSVTGTRYQFTFTGERLLIDYRDVSGMRAEPLLQKVKAD
jgi:hypothetical protein